MEALLTTDYTVRLQWLLSEKLWAWRHIPVTPSQHYDQ